MRKLAIRDRPGELPLMTSADEMEKIIGDTMESAEAAAIESRAAHWSIVDGQHWRTQWTYRRDVGSIIFFAQDSQGNPREGVDDILCVNQPESKRAQYQAVIDAAKSPRRIRLKMLGRE